MAALFGTSANLVTAITAAAPGPFGSAFITGGSITVNVGTGIAGNNTITIGATSGGNSAYVQMPVAYTASNGSAFGIGFQFASAPSGTNYWLTFLGSTTSMQLGLTSTGALVLHDASGTSTTGAVLSTGVRHYVEIYIPTFATAQTVQINVDGSSYLTILNANCNTGYPVNVNLGYNTANTPCTIIFDSIYMLDTTTGNNINILGPRVVTYGIAAGVGQYSAYTPNGAATDWQSVDSIPPPGDTTYASDATAGDQLAVAIGAVSGLGSVNFINIEATVRQEVSAGGRTIALGVGNGTAAQYGSTRGLGTTYATLSQVFDGNPNAGNAPWTVGNLTTMQPAVETMS